MAAPATAAWMTESATETSVADGAGSWMMGEMLALALDRRRVPSSVVAADRGDWGDNDAVDAEVTTASVVDGEVAITDDRIVVVEAAAAGLARSASRVFRTSTRSM